ncbi:hypothetical protein [Streptomyces buecherae]|uniref:Uncharacterized protein n=1 Tax=Streptomyces buecherae TaxID=2763006 RepID=A0A7H8N1F7_9ACTN|nr:hypothetical protein [Streptomyces buecherae]QKW48191.1 hypothetical protein HUT08_22560 [Streptomyces buecherae]
MLLTPREHIVNYAELGMEVDPPAPYSARAWLASVADQLSNRPTPDGPPPRKPEPGP